MAEREAQQPNKDPGRSFRRRARGYRWLRNASFRCHPTMVAADELTFRRTNRFCVLATHDEVGSLDLPVLSLSDLLLGNRSSTNLATQLHAALKDRGFFLLTCPKTSRPGLVIEGLRECVGKNLFPDDNNASLPVGENVYLSEKGVPMYRLGYELSDDGVREFFRVAAAEPDDPPLENGQEAWLRGLGLCRHVTDTALDLLVTQPRRQKRAGSGATSWTRQRPSTPNRPGDFSVLYAMNYFNRPDIPLPQDGIALKQHVDPSLLVMETVLNLDTPGLQVWDKQTSKWLDCDGPKSPAHLFPDQCVSLIFGGKALAAHSSIEPTLHRVVAGHCQRRTVIYEQKYEEFYPPPVMD